MNALNEISKTLKAMGANPAPVSDTELKVNAPDLNRLEKSCETCANLASCKKEIGVIWGFCNVDYIPAEGAKQ